MYNLTVAQDHTFAVGVDQWIVHNECLPNRDQVQKLVQENEGIQRKIQNPDEPGGNPEQWTLKSMQKSLTSNSDLAPYTDRYYLNFRDGAGSSVKISGNYNPDDGTWHDPTFHFSSDQPDPGKWGPDGFMRTSPDPGAAENPMIEDIDKFLELFGDE